MKNFIKENLVLVIGLALPVLLIVLFFVATVIPKAYNTPPQYEVLFSVVNYNYQNRPDFDMSFSVKNKQLMVKPKKIEGKDNYNNTKKLMAYDAKTETLREIAMDVSKFSDGAAMVLEETQAMTIDAATTSPDGYVLEGSNYNGNGLVGDLFGGGYRNQGYRLKKGSIGYKISNQQGNNYYDQMQFIGWVVKK